jgi:hypothetical protein
MFEPGAKLAGLLLLLVRHSPSGIGNFRSDVQLPQHSEVLQRQPLKRFGPKDYSAVVKRASICLNPLRELFARAAALGRATRISKTNG